MQKPVKTKPEFQLADSLDGLFDQLKKTGDRRRAKRVEERIWMLWRASDSKSVDLLTGWARSAMGKKNYSQALDLLDQVLVMRPNYAEAWNQRATLHFMRSQYGKSIADIERTLALEPRHFGALSGLAVILERMGQRKRALDVWYRTLAIYPAMKNAQSSVARLEEQLAGAKL
ncbi:MAG: tetratricopeptide repeat protein [Pseudomonadota bacterium]